MLLAYLIGFAELLNDCYSCGLIDPPPTPPTIEQQIDESLQNQYLPEGEIRDIRLQAKHFADEVKERRWSEEQVKSARSRLRWSVVESTIPATFDAELFGPSGLEVLEQRDARRAMRRYCRALVNRKLDGQTAKALEAMVYDADTHRLRDDLRDDQLRDFVASVHQAADKWGIPASVPAIDASDAFAAEVERLLSDDGNKTP